MTDYAPIFSAVTGVELSREDFQKCAERIVCLDKAYNPTAQVYAEHATTRKLYSFQ